MILGAPRSGTAWAANWLSTERTLCLHDPLFNRDLDELDQIPCDRTLGVADTGLLLFPGFLARHPARKVILHRDLGEIENSLRRAGLPPLERNWDRELREIDGLHVDWRDLFERPGMIYEYLFGHLMSDYPRHQLLCKLNVQMDFEKIDPDPAVTRRMLERMRADVR